jgi:hypothetical protein
LSPFSPLPPLQATTMKVKIVNANAMAAPTRLRRGRE